MDDKQINLDDIKKQLTKELKDSHLDEFTGQDKELLSHLIDITAEISKKFMQEYLKRLNNK